MNRGTPRPVSDIAAAQNELRKYGIEIGWIEGQPYRVRLQTQRRITFIASEGSAREAITSARRVLRALERALPDARRLFGPISRRGAT